MTNTYDSVDDALADYEAVKHGNKIVKKQLRSDEKDLEAALDEAIKESNQQSKS